MSEPQAEEVSCARVCGIGAVCPDSMVSLVLEFAIVES